MSLVRRSISFPEDVYEALRLEAFSQRVSVNQLITQKITPARKRFPIDEQLKRDFSLFDRIAASGVKYDAAKAVREERDRDEA